MSFVVATFYHFFDFKYFTEHKQSLKDELTRLGIKGSLLIAAEGINATLSGTREAIDSFIAHLEDTIVKEKLERKESFHDTQPFKRTKVRLKKETISLGEPITSTQTGTYVDAQEWNALISDPDTILLDTRNSYEVHLGTFQGAIDPAIRNFKQLPDFVRHRLSGDKDKKIATFCTGGIRCEKFTGWLLDQGFKDVYHLKGGILKYLEDVPESQSLWQGECYVFDERVAVGHGLKPSQSASMCRACGHALTSQDRENPAYKEGHHCPFCYHPIEKDDNFS
jgi:UPF0176 protein